MVDSKILKRFELIKTLIALKEGEDIEEQITKIEQAEQSQEIKNIIVSLKQKQYSQAIREIDILVRFQHQLDFYIDPEIEALKFEAKALEKKIQELSSRKAELERLIHEFDFRYNYELGETLLQILKFRIEKAKDTITLNEATNDFEEFTKDYNASLDNKVFELSIDELKELKDKYRRASKLCHPDVVTEEFKEGAHQIFTELNEAYDANDLVMVSKILNNLETGIVFKSKVDTAIHKESLDKEIRRLKNRILEIENLVSDILNSDAYLKIPEMETWDKYFQDRKEQLVEHLEKLEDGE